MKGVNSLDNPAILPVCDCNPRCTFAAKVTVLGFVYLCVCLSVSQHLTSQMSNQAINKRAYSVACERQNSRGDLPEMTAFKSYAARHNQKYANYSGLVTHGHLSLLDTQRSTRDSPTTVNNINDAY